MASHEIPFVQTIESRLRELLPVAQDIKVRHGVSSLYDSKSEDEYAQLQRQLQDIFNNAREVNGETDVSTDGADPPSATAASAFQLSSLEAAARNLLYSLLSKHSIDSPEFDVVWNLLDLLIMCTSPTGPDGTGAATCEPSLPLWLIEELFDSQTIVGCRRVFDYLESSWHFLLHASGTDKGPGISNNTKMILLRSCNELLRRLSRAEDAVFCGRIFMFLFGSFPLGDKSSVNLRGDFHTENTTVFDDVTRPKEDEVEQDASADGETKEGEEHANEEVQSDPVAAANGGPVQNSENGIEDTMEVDPEIKEEQATGATNGEKIGERKAGDEGKQETTTTDSEVAAEAKKLEEEKIDTDAFYTTFWSLQNIFSNPTKLFEQEEFPKFQQGLQLTLDKFKATPKVLQTHGTPQTPGEGKRGTKRRRSTMEADFASNFNPKYLTSRDLFELELSDMTFQRHVLVQSLILIDFLLSLTPKAKKKLTELKAQRAMLYNYTLTEEDTKWAISTRAKVASYLQDGPDGKFYYRMADTVLARDKNWVRWKVESCPPIEKAPMPSEDALEARTSTRRACTARRMKSNLDGGVDLDFLSDTENINHLGRLKGIERVSRPDEEVYLGNIDTIDLDLEMATDEEKPYLLETKASSMWRTLRLVSKHRLGMFARIDEADGLKALRGPDVPEEAEILEDYEKPTEAEDSTRLELPEESQKLEQTQDLEELEESRELDGSMDLGEATQGLVATEPSEAEDLVLTEADARQDIEEATGEEQTVVDESTHFATAVAEQAAADESAV